MGSVMGQAICRDAFEGADRGRVFATIGAAMCLSPALGPVVGGLLAEYVSWRMIFMLFFIGALATCLLGFKYLPETHSAVKRQGPKPQIFQVAVRMIKDPKVLIFGVLVGGVNGIGFSYYGEGPFYLITLLGLSPSLYGLSFVAIAAAFLIGSLYSKSCHERHIPYQRIIQWGLSLVLFPALLFVFFAVSGVMTLERPVLSALITIGCMFVSAMGTGLIVSNTLAFALDHKYQDCVGTASSLFGAYYYTIVAVVTFVLGTIRQNNLWLMPTYFCCIGIVLLGAYRWWLRRPVGLL